MDLFQPEGFPDILTNLVIAPMVLMVTGRKMLANGRESLPTEKLDPTKPEPVVTRIVSVGT